MGGPLVSIVTATFNRADVLRLTIESALASSFTDWEMLVIGDGCTDHSGAVVRDFGDPRLSFHNLPANFGEQSGPNNEGVNRSRAPFVAFLNHDDLWTPHHLALALNHLQEQRADIVSTLTVVVDPNDRPVLSGCCTADYHPRFSVPASSWLMRREVFEAVGPWRPATELHIQPSTDWLYRAWRQGCRIRCLQRATVLAVQSGGRRGSYLPDAHHANAMWATRFRDEPSLIETLLAEIAAGERDRLTRLGFVASFVRVAKNKAIAASLRAGCHPIALRHALRYRRRGGFIDALRRTRGLQKLDRGKHRAQTVRR